MAYKKNANFIAMKNLLIFFLLYSLIACQQDTATPPLNNDGSTVVGAWKVKSYINNKAKDQSSNYAAYTFNFLENGTLEAVKNSTKTKGSYMFLSDSGKKKFQINFTSGPIELAEFNEDWYMAEKTPIQITTNVSGGNGGTSTLVFVK
jgi:hypothetical protein